MDAALDAAAARSRELLLSCRGVRVAAGGKQIVRGVDLEIRSGEIHALMGPNGSGKSTLAAALMGHPGLELSGSFAICGTPAGALGPEQRARLGLFLGFQHPVPVPGVPVAGFLRAALAALGGSEPPVREFRAALDRVLAELGIPREFAARHLGDGFSGGERKRLEAVQLLLLQPRVALLDEIDSGLDIDALKVVARAVGTFAAGGGGLVLITHYQRLLGHLRPQRVHVFAEGRIVESGGPELAERLEREGYDRFKADPVRGR